MAVVLTFPGSDLLPVDEFHLRRALVGGTLSRAWVSFMVGATRYVVSIRHNGSGANPIPWVAALTGATHVEVSLPASAQTGAQVATAVAVALTGAGVASTRVGAQLSLASAHTLLEAPMMTTDESLRGMWGAQRLNYGGNDFGAQQGATGGTGSVHLTNPGAGRVLGVYIRGGSGMQPRLAYGVGPAYSTDPGAITIRGQGRVSAPVNNADLAFVLFTEPVTLGAGESVWVVFRENAGTLTYRSHGQTPEGNADAVSGERLIWDTTASTDPTVAIAASYDPTANNTFTIYPHIGLIYERGPTYPGRGNISTIIGCHRDTADSAADGGTVAQTLTSEMVDEAVGFRLALPNWTDARLTQLAIALSAWSAAEDVGAALYQFGDIAIPSAASNALLRSIGPLGTTGTGWNVHTLASPVPVGVGDLGSNPIVGVFVNAGARNGAGTLGTLRILFDDENPNGTESWPTLWGDDGRQWDDRIAPFAEPTPYWNTTPYRMLGPMTEYRTLGSLGTTNPVGDPNDAWPNPLDNDPADAPRNLLRLYVVEERDGIASSESAGGLVPSTAPIRRRRAG